MGRRRTTVCGLLGVPLAVAVTACGVSSSPEPGAVVERCEPGYAASRAGLEPGEVIVGRRRGVIDEPIESPFDLARLELMKAPRGPVELIVKRQGRERPVVLSTGIWGIEVVPVLGNRMERDRRKALRCFEEGRVEDGLNLMDGIVRELEEGDGRSAAAWILMDLIVAVGGGDRAEACRDLIDRADTNLEDEVDRAVFRDLLGRRLVESGHPREAGDVFLEALEIARDRDGADPVVADLLYRLCRLDFRRCSSETASESLTIYRREALQSLEVARARKLLGTVSYFRSDWTGAEAEYRRGLELTRDLAPDHPWICDFLGNLGLVALKKGDFNGARALFLEELEEVRRLGSPPQQLGYATNYLGLLAKKTGRYEEARQRFEQALKVFHEERPGGPEEAGVLTNLGNVAMREGDFRSARDHHLRALEQRRSIEPGSSEVAESRHNVGVALRRMGRSDEARKELEEALALKRRLAPGSEWVATTLIELGGIALDEGRLEMAEDLAREALKLRSRLLPGHPLLAESLFLMGRVFARTDREEQAEELWRRAIAIIEDRRRVSGLTEEERSRFGGVYFGFYRALAALLVEKGRAVEAFELVEEGRNGALCAMMTEQIAVPAGVPPELWFEKVRVETQIGRLEARRARIGPENQAERLKTLEETLDRLTEEHRRLSAEIESFVPRFERFRRTPPVEIENVWKVLDPGTVLVSFVVDDRRSVVFALFVDREGRGVIEAEIIPAGKEELTRRIDVFRALIRRGSEETVLEEALEVQAGRLFEVVFPGSGRNVLEASRLLIIPDGPLFDLPFAALADPQTGAFLGRTSAIVLNASAGIVARLGDLRVVGRRPPSTVVVFGDPSPIPGGRVGRTRDFDPLPGSRRETEAIARIFGEDAQTFLGEAATEETFRAHAPGAGLLHFGVHTVVDRYRPMESALILAPGGDRRGDQSPESNDGLLTASEIMDGPAIEARVVTLSGCETAEGRDVPGEGILGLARAFRLAGARSVVATLWPVADRPTASLMEGLYRRIHRGEDPAEALRNLRIERLDHGGLGSHPFDWAAFRVIGDWKPVSSSEPLIVEP